MKVCVFSKGGGVVLGCAWVLWFRLLYPTDDPMVHKPSKYMMYDAYESKKECEHVALVSDLGKVFDRTVCLPYGLTPDDIAKGK